MADYINKGYIGIGAYDLQRYYDLLLIMREYHRSDSSKSEENNFIMVLVILVLFVVLFGWSILNREWLVLFITLGLAVAILWVMKQKDDKHSNFESGFITKVMDAGFSRADAIEFLYDLDWDDIDYGESRVDDILRDIEELNNAKNK